MDIIALIGAIGSIIGVIGGAILIWNKMTSRINEVNKKQQDWIDSWPTTCANHRRELFDKLERREDKMIDRHEFNAYKEGVENRLNRLENK